MMKQPRFISPALSVVISMLSLFLSSSIQAGMRPYFLILENNSNLESFSKSIEIAGAKIRQTVPPQILVADFPDTADLGLLSSVQHVYAGVIPMIDLKNMGLMEKAAGIEWNKNLLTETKTKNVGAMSVMSLSVARQTLLSPENLQARVQGNRILVTWEQATGSLLTEIQISADENFSTTLSSAKTGLVSLNLPLPVSQSGRNLYVRARSTDRPEATDKQSDIVGEWTSVVSLSAPVRNAIVDLVSPTLTSPLDKYESIGFTLILEWTNPDAPLTRVQISTNKSFSQPWMDIVVDDKSFIVPSSALHIGEPVYWRVMSYGDHESGWSNVRQFSVKEPRHPGTDMFVNPEAPQ